MNLECAIDTVLVIESDPADLLALSLVLHASGYTVLDAGSRGEAWHLCSAHGGTIHVVLANAILDGSSGDFLNRLGIAYPGIRAVIVDNMQPAPGIEAPSMPRQCAFLQRPVRPEALAATIASLLENAKMGIGFSHS